MVPTLRPLARLALLAALAAPGAAAADSIAITLDDLPFVGGLGPGDSAVAANRRILAALAKHRAPAAGFVVCDRIDPEASVLKAWLDAGHRLGNHSSTHRHFDRLDLEAWVTDVRRCKARLDGIVGRPTRWFRYPFLQRGRTPAARDAGVAALKAMGHTPAPVSVDTGEWILVAPYVAALRRGDAETAAAIGAAYVEHVVAASRHARAVARQHPGRAIPHVLLLHANALAADHLDPLLAALAREGFGFVTLDAALADPVYAEPDRYAGPIGLSWLYRIAPAGDAGERWRWDAGQTRALARRFGGEAESEAPIDHDLTLRPVAAGTWVVTHDVWKANLLLAEMPDGTLLLADTPSTPDATARLLVWLRARFGERAVVAINSHHHVDALGGNAMLIAAGATTWGSDRTAALVVEEAAAMKAALVVQQPGHFDDLVFTPPARRFPLAEGLTLDFGEPVRVIHPGPGHAVDNVVVWLPKRRVLFGGCAIFGGPRPGYVGAADLERWPASVRSLAALDPAVVVPGHGPRLDPGLIEHTADAVTRFVAERAEGDRAPTD